MNHEETGRHRRYKLVGIIVGCVCAGLFLLGMFLFWLVPRLLLLIMFVWRPYKYTQSSVSPGGEYTVTVKATDAQGFFGPANVKVIARDGWRREVYETEIADDGGHGGVRIFWLEEDTARVVLYGSEQTDEAITITFSDGAPVLEAVQPPKPEPVPEELQEGAVHSIWVSIHDGEHVFWVGLYQESADPDAAKVVVYDRYRQEIVQVFEDTSQAPDGIHWPGSDDINGDGYTDFYYRIDDERTVYLWDPQAERFVQDSADVREVSGEMAQPNAAHAQQIDIGDGEHSFFVEVVDTGESAQDCGTKFLVSIYTAPEGGILLQTFEDIYYNSYPGEWAAIKDVDFDGDLDFYFIVSRGAASNLSYSFYIWDEQQERFVSDPYGLNDLCLAAFDDGSQVVENYIHTSNVSNINEYYRYLDGQLTCIRRMEQTHPTAEGIQYLIVEDYRDGTLIEVFRAEMGSEFLGDDVGQAYMRWHDLDYHGEE